MRGGQHGQGMVLLVADCGLMRQMWSGPFVQRHQNFELLVARISEGKTPFASESKKSAISGNRD
jgi:hypothetical protein